MKLQRALPGCRLRRRRGSSERQIEQPVIHHRSSTLGGGLVNVNTASLELLTTLPGIGPTKAAAIIAERPFDSVEALERVPEGN